MVITLIGCLTLSYKVSLSCSGPMLWVFCTNRFRFHTRSQCVADWKMTTTSYSILKWLVKCTLRSVQLQIELCRTCWASRHLYIFPRGRRQICPLFNPGVFRKPNRTAAWPYSSTSVQTSWRPLSQGRLEKYFYQLTHLFQDISLIG